MATLTASKVFVKPNRGRIPCPYFRPAGADSVYRVRGFCTGVHGSAPMIPTIEECANWCCTADYGACPIYRDRRLEKEEEPSLEEQGASCEVDG